jgi:hypothetical protein
MVGAAILQCVRKNAALMPDVRTFADSFLASVRAGLAFSGEADPPLTLERAATGVCQSERVD